uniref:Putative lipocalin-6 1 n=1 Tax=Amblyomma triste TaxID=251400 RepID=A0A023G9Z6_AMBTT
MVGFAVLILCAQFINVFSNENADTCESPTSSDGSTDGYTVLAEDRKFRLVFMTITVNEAAYRCVTTTTIAKDDSKHQVTEHVEFTASCLENCFSYNRTFKFESESGRYNKMTSVKEPGFHPATYKFLLADENCTIVKDITPRSHLTEHIRVEQRNTNSADSTQQKTGDCMLWVDNKIAQPDQNCLQRFNTLCGRTLHSFSQVDCTMPAPASQAQEKDKTQP